MSFQSDNSIMQTFTISKRLENYCKKMVPIDQMFGISVSVMLCNDAGCMKQLSNSTN